MFNCLVAIGSSVLLAFGLYNIHSISGVTEGGSLGLVLLLEHWFNISPAISGFIMNLLAYGLGWKLFGKDFLIYSFIASGAFSLSYGVFEQFPHLWPQLADMPLAASLLGSVFVGLGAGLTVWIGGASGSDDAIAMSLSHITKIDIQWIYLLSDVIVLLISLTYIPFTRIAYSLLTVILSGQIIGLIQKIPLPEISKKKADT